MRRNPIVCIDTETTGRDASIHGILTLGAVTLYPDNRIGNPLYLKHRIEDGAYVVEPKALEVNGIDIEEHNKDALSSADFQMKFDYYCKDVMALSVKREVIRFMGYNVDFDIRFLAALQENLYEDLTFPGARIDVQSKLNELYAEGITDIRSIKLDKVAPLFGITTLSHNALGDARTTAELYLVLKNLEEEYATRNS